jgi:NAD(P)-dependent dehydrogenase (short-subunit alcohol dehydrogenase family)
VVLDGSSRVLVATDAGGVGDALADRLEALGATVVTLDLERSADEIEAAVSAARADGAIQGVFWLPALDREPPMGDLDLDAWRELLRRRVKLLYTTMRALGDDVGPAGTFLVAATRLGGRHGYDPAGAVAPMGGAVSGFTKAFRRERPGALVKAVDLPLGREAATVADALVDECRRDPGCVEVGHDDRRHRWTVGLVEQPAAAGSGLTLGPESVFVVTGAAGSIVSAITTDLAAASGGTFHLLDLTPEPSTADADIARFAFDRDGLKNDLIDRMKADGERVTPVMVERELARIERLAAARAAIDAVEAAGGTVHYHAVDLTDPVAVGTVVEDIRSRHDRVDALIHAAGLEISHMLADKERSEFDLVFDVKCDGWFNLMRALEGFPIGATVVFSSVAGRFGNGGQTDYSAANDLLCKATSHLRTARPDTHAIAIDWTAWDEIGMATRGSIPKMMEAAGIDMLAPAVGIPTVRRELTGSSGAEVLVAGRLGVLLEEPDLTGGIDPGTVDTAGCGPMVDRLVTVGVHSGHVVETTLDPTTQGFLDDHRIDGTAVLPGVMGIEAFAEVAQLAVPDWHVVAVEDVDFHAPCKLYRDEPRTITIRAHVRPDGDDIVARCRLVASRLLPNQTEPQVTTHFTGTVRLRPEPDPAPTTDLPATSDDGGVTAEDVYRVYFHGPAYQVVERVRGDGDTASGWFAPGRPLHHQPADEPLTMAPRLVELCFQTAGVHELGVEGRWALPTHVDRVATWGDEDDAGPIVAVVRPRDDGAFDARVVGAQGRVLVELEGYRTVDVPDAVDPDLLGPLADAMR